jgi:hypothetical protein
MTDGIKALQDASIWLHVKHVMIQPCSIWKVTERFGTSFYNRNRLVPDSTLDNTERVDVPLVFSGLSEPIFKAIYYLGQSKLRAGSHYNWGL